MDPNEAVRRVVAWTGHSLPPGGYEALIEYSQFLVDEAIPAGGLGPNEAPRVWDRHICDSLAFAAGCATTPGSGVDLGSGVGLPGIPLSILWPDTQWTLLDRSGRRVHLLRRAIRVLSLPNVIVEHDDVDRYEGALDLVVARGMRNPPSLLSSCRRVLKSGGRGIIGLSRGNDDEGELEPGLSVISVPAEVLDGGARILIIDARDR